MTTIEKFNAPGVFEPATYSQGIKVTQAQTILLKAGRRSTFMGRFTNIWSLRRLCDRRLVKPKDCVAVRRAEQVSDVA